MNTFMLWVKELALHSTGQMRASCALGKSADCERDRFAQRIKGRSTGCPGYRLFNVTCSVLDNG